MAGDHPGLIFKDKLWQVRLQRRIDGRKVEISHSLGTNDRKLAIKLYHGGGLEKAEAKLHAKGSARPPAAISAAVSLAHEAMAAFASKIVRAKVLEVGGPTRHWPATIEAERWNAAFEHPEAYKLVPDFDDTVLSILHENGYSAGDWVLPHFRREAALYVAYAIQHIERARLAEAHRRQSLDILNSDLDDLAATPDLKDKPRPSITLSELYSKWVVQLAPASKERGRLDHQMRRLIEFFGDVPCNYLTKREAAEFMSWVARFPGRKRNAETNKRPMRELVLKFEEDNLRLTQAEMTPIKTLTVTTAREWFAHYKRMFGYGVRMDYFQNSAFDLAPKDVVRGSPPIKRRQFTDDEMSLIFSQPLFKSGPKNVKYWLPIISLLHAGRLSEFAETPISDLVQSKAGTWFFELDPPHERRLKNENARRRIPIHPKAIDLGFINYVESLRRNDEKWLFPDLDHESAHGAGHEYSKWFGAWLDDIGLSDPAITHHSWRHTWKSVARVSPVEEEIRDMLAGHAPASVGRAYGAGAPIDFLAQEMAKIEFPAFPL